MPLYRSLILNHVTHTQQKYNNHPAHCWREIGTSVQRQNLRMPSYRERGEPRRMNGPELDRQALRRIEEWTDKHNLSMAINYYSVNCSFNIL
jgi:hypothetical protein